MRSKRKRANSVKALGWIGVAVVTAGIGAAAVVWEPWNGMELPWRQGAEPVAIRQSEPDRPASETAKKIQNVSKADAILIVEVDGAAPPSPSARALLDKMNGLELPAGEPFYFTEWLESTGLGGADADYGYAASLLYEAAVRAGLEIGERHLHQRLPDYANPGFDVFVKPGSNELSLLNPADAPVIVGIRYIDGTPKLSLSAPASAGLKAKTAGVRVLTYEPEVAHVIDKSLQAGAKEQRQTGLEGMKVQVSADGKRVSEDFYLPDPAVVASGPAQPDEAQSIAVDGGEQAQSDVQDVSASRP